MSSDNKGISVLFTYRHIFLFSLLLFCYFRHYWKAGTGPFAHFHAKAESLTPAWWMSLAGGGSANQGLDEMERGFWWGQFPDGKRHKTALSFHPWHTRKMSVFRAERVASPGARSWHLSFQTPRNRFLLFSHPQCESLCGSWQMDIDRVREYW